MTILDGKALADGERQRIHTSIAKSGITPGLASLFVGDDPASALYLKVKERACAKVGIHFERLDFPDSVGQHEVLGAMEKLNGRKDIHGILVQLPLPSSLDTDGIIKAMDPRKDVDGFHPDNLAALERGEDVRYPVLVKAILALLAATGTEPTKQHVVLLSKNDVFSRPFQYIFTHLGARFSRSATLDSALTKQADILITALSAPRTITANYIQEGAILLDVSTTPAEGKMVGDVVAESVASKASFLSPVPGGVGPLTVAMLLENTAIAAGVDLS